MRTRRLNVALCCTLALLGLVAWTLAGPLNPPAGPVAPTYKTLTEVEPRTMVSAATTPGDATAVYIISQAGSYYLTGNISVPGAKSGIRITASDVTLDLNGFAIFAGTTSVNGVVGAGTLSAVTVRNGTVVGFPGRGLDIASISGGCVQDVIARACGGVGIAVGSITRVERCSAYGCAGGGISGGNGSTIDHCSARQCGVAGLAVDNGGRLIDCEGYANLAVAILASNNCSVLRCTAVNNGGNGFQSQANVTYTDCFSSGASGDGFQLGSDCTVLNCQSSNSGVRGFFVGGRSVIRGCTADSSQDAGIVLAGPQAVAEGNTCLNNVTAGIRTTAAQTLVIRNVATGVNAATVNYSFVAGTRFGPVVNATGAGAAVTVAAGTSVASPYGTAAADANYSYY